MAAEISRSELSGRVAVLRRFRSMLERQKEHFKSYLALLERQEAAIGSGSGDDILAHVELEEQVIADIFAMQKVIVPLEGMYRALPAPASVPASAEEKGIPELRVSLDDMRERVRAKSARNRELLSRRMTEVRAEMTALRDNPFARNARRGAFGEVVTASVVDLRG